ncbi:MAG: hypothetical protein AB1611_04685 [bacterium]
MVNAQKEWESQEIIKVSNLRREQILIRSGETFKANHVLREIISNIHSELCVIDPYMGETFFDIIEGKTGKISIRIITSAKVSKAALISYEAFRNQYPNTEMRRLDSEKLHDRYILWDKAHGFHIGHSIKDLGKKDTQLNLLLNPIEQVNLFEHRWKESTPDLK